MGDGKGISSSVALPTREFFGRCTVISEQRGIFFIDYCELLAAFFLSACLLIKYRGMH